MGHHSYVASEMNHLLKSTAIFACLTPEDIDFVMSLSDRLTLQDGQEIFRDGDNPTRFFVVIEGEVVIRTGEDVGHKTDIARFLPGDCFGELDFFTAERRTATALAVNPTQLLGFPPDNSSLSDISEKWPMVSARLFHGFLIHISSRIRKANAFVKSNSVLVRELKRQAYVDKLTGLFNKLYFEETLGNTLKSGSHGGLLMYKPDNFKQINDEYGHEAGDNILQFVAKALRQVVPDENLLFRYTGNENAVILPGATRESLWECGKKIGEFLRSLDLSPVHSSIDYPLSVSVGLSLFPDHGSQIANLIETTHALTLEGRRRGGNLTLFPEDSDET